MAVKILLVERTVRIPNNGQKRFKRNILCNKPYRLAPWTNISFPVLAGRPATSSLPSFWHTQEYDTLEST